MDETIACGEPRGVNVTVESEPMHRIESLHLTSPLPFSLDDLPVAVLQTDGRSNPRPIEEAVSAAEDAKAQGVVIFTIGLGPSVESDALREIASAPEFFYRAPDGEDLAGIYERIAVEVPCPADRFWGRR